MDELKIVYIMLTVFGIGVLSFVGWQLRTQKAIGRFGGWYRRDEDPIGFWIIIIAQTGIGLACISNIFLFFD